MNESTNFPIFYELILLYQSEKRSCNRFVNIMSVVSAISRASRSSSLWKVNQISKVCVVNALPNRLFSSTDVSKKIDIQGVYAPFTETLAFSEPAPHVLHVQLNRPEKMNALKNKSWYECRDAFNQITQDPKVRSVLLTGAGKHFCAGIDLMDFMQLAGGIMQQEDVSRRCVALKKVIKEFQSAFTAVAECSKPVIVAVHGACIGGGIDLITACDIRLAARDSAMFSVKEVDIGIAADVGTLQRLGKVVGSDSWVRDVCLTARNFDAEEAFRVGLVSGLSKDANSVYGKRDKTRSFFRFIRLRCGKTD